MIFPHCDAGILHAPGECIHCDTYPEWQKLREIWGINFTGHYEEGKILCPSERSRKLEQIYRWHGNIPKK